MNIKQYDIWLANLNPQRGTEPGKIRPVVILQTDLLNEVHSSTIICIITSKVLPDSELLRLHLKKGQLDKLSDVVVDQLRAIDNRKLIKRLGNLTKDQAESLREKIKIVLDL
jgi:mRNA interferase MazF